MVLGDSAVNSYIRAWKKSRLGHVQAWPEESIIAKIVKWGQRLDPTYTHANAVSDGDLMAMIVLIMRKYDPESYESFVAFHLRVINGRRHPKIRDYQLADMLGIHRTTFKARRKRGFEFVRNQLEARFDSAASFSS